MRSDDQSKMTYAKQAAILILDCYQSSLVGNEQTFTAGFVDLLAGYRRDVIERAKDPARGIPSKVMLPNLAQFKKALDAIDTELHGYEAARQRRSMLPELPAPDVSPQERERIIAGFDQLLNRLNKA